MDDFGRFLRHFNARRYRDALLAVENCWIVERNEFLQGLVQLSGALNQMQLGRATGPRYLLTRAREKIRPCAPRHRGMNVGLLLRFIDDCLALVPPVEGKPVEPPPLRLQRVAQTATLKPAAGKRNS